MQVEAVVPAHVPPVQEYDLGELLQLAVKVTVLPAETDEGFAIKVHVGVSVGVGTTGVLEKKFAVTV